MWKSHKVRRSKRGPVEDRAYTLSHIHQKSQPYIIPPPINSPYTTIFNNVPHPAQYTLPNKPQLQSSPIQPSRSIRTIPTIHPSIQPASKNHNPISTVLFSYDTPTNTSALPELGTRPSTQIPTITSSTIPISSSHQPNNTQNLPIVKTPKQIPFPSSSIYTILSTNPSPIFFSTYLPRASLDRGFKSRCCGTSPYTRAKSRKVPGFSCKDHQLTTWKGLLKQLMVNEDLKNFLYKLQGEE